jgi:hypothetical protein
MACQKVGPVQLKQIDGSDGANIRGTGFKLSPKELLLVLAPGDRIPQTSVLQSLCEVTSNMNFISDAPSFLPPREGDRNALFTCVHKNSEAKPVGKNQQKPAT